MSAFSGRQYRGARRELRKQKRQEAEDRARDVKLESTRQYRLASPLLRETARLERDRLIAEQEQADA